jgi:hypothetical protein
VKYIVKALPIIKQELTANTVPGNNSEVALKIEPNATGPESHMKKYQT